MKRKRIYYKPLVEVVKLKSQAQLLTGSGVSATRNDYGEAIEEEDWE